MNLLKWPIFKAGIFKQAKYLVSTPHKAQDVLEILETGVVAIEPFPMRTGFVQAPSKDVRLAWANMHTLKAQIYKDGSPADRAAALPISERSFIPLDPMEVLKPKDREKFASLDDIALTRHDDAMVETTPSNITDIQRMIINLGFAFLFFLGVIALIKGC